MSDALAYEVHCFDHVVMTVAEHTNVLLFSDGKFNIMDRRHLGDDYAAIAAWAGYPGDERGYNIEHDLTHCFVAEQKGQKWCPVLRDPFPGPLDQAPKWMQDVEYEVNALQRLLRGCDDPDPHGRLGWVTPEQLRLLSKVVE